MIAELVDRILAGDDDAVWELEEVIEDEPAALQPYLVRLLDLLDADVYIPETVFRAAGEDLQREAVARIDAGGHADYYLLRVLTETRGPVVEAAFSRWLKDPPPGTEASFLAPFLTRFGWEFDGDGHAREICGTTEYGLTPMGETEPSRDRCPWCGTELWTALDVDTAVPRVAAALAHTSWSGRLRIVTCLFCASYRPMYVEVTPDGGATWSAYTGEPPARLTLVPEPEPPPLVRLIPSERPPGESASRIGGRPHWLQDPDYPACPGCGKVMAYVGRVGPSDIFGEGRGDGLIYLFLHTPCGLAAVLTQYT